MKGSRSWVKSIAKFVLIFNCCLNIPGYFLTQNLVCASSVSDSISAYDVLANTCRKIYDQKGYDLNKPLEFVTTRGVYIPCNNGNNVKVTWKDYGFIVGEFEDSLRNLIIGFDYGVFVPAKKKLKSKSYAPPVIAPQPVKIVAPPSKPVYGPAISAPKITTKVKRFA